MIEPTVNDVLALPKFILLLTNMYVHSKLMIITGSLNSNSICEMHIIICLIYVYTGQRSSGDIWKKSKKDNSGTEFGHTWLKTGHPIGKLKETHQ